MRFELRSQVDPVAMELVHIFPSLWSEDFYLSVIIEFPLYLFREPVFKLSQHFGEASRVAAQPSLLSYFTVIWDGSPNGLTTVDAYVASVVATVSKLTGGYIVIAPVAVGATATGTPGNGAKQTVEIYNKLVAAGVNTFNPMSVLNEAADGSPTDNLFIASGLVAPSLRADPSDIFHLNGKAHDTVAKAINEQHTVAITAVPGPDAGAGIGALAMLGVMYLAKRRRALEAT